MVVCRRAGGNLAEAHSRSTSLAKGCGSIAYKSRPDGIFLFDVGPARLPRFTVVALVFYATPLLFLDRADGDPAVLRWAGLAAGFRYETIGANYTAFVPHPGRRRRSDHAAMTIGLFSQMAPMRG